MVKDGLLFGGTGLATVILVAARDEGHGAQTGKDEQKGLDVLHGGVSSWGRWSGRRALAG